MSHTETLLRMIGSPLLERVPECDYVESEQLFRYAFRNNIEMLYLDVLAKRGHLNLLLDKQVEIQARRDRKSVV